MNRAILQTQAPGPHPAEDLPEARSGDGSTRRRRWRARLATAGVAVAAAATIAVSVPGHIPQEFDRYMLVPKPTGVYLSQSAFAQLQRQVSELDAASRYDGIGLAFQVSMLRGNVSVGKMVSTSQSILKVYRHGVSELDHAAKAERILADATSINDPSIQSPEAEAQAVYGGALGLISLSDIARNLAISTDQEIANQYYATMVYYNIDDSKGEISYYLTLLATDQLVHHGGTSAQQEIMTNAQIAERALQNIALIYASGANIYRINYPDSASAADLYNAAQSAVDRTKIMHRIVVPALPGSAILAGGILFAIGLPMERRRKRSNPFLQNALESSSPPT